MSESKLTLIQQANKIISAKAVTIEDITELQKIKWEMSVELSEYAVLA